MRTNWNTHSEIRLNNIVESGIHRFIYIYIYTHTFDCVHALMLVFIYSYPSCYYHFYSCLLLFVCSLFVHFFSDLLNRLQAPDGATGDHENKKLGDQINNLIHGRRGWGDWHMVSQISVGAALGSRGYLLEGGESPRMGKHFGMDTVHPRWAHELAAHRDGSDAAARAASGPRKGPAPAMPLATLMLSPQPIVEGLLNSRRRVSDRPSSILISKTPASKSEIVILWVEH